jgi:murein DD-endopeptidase MepM/ murein hydrolase activator NlpD
MSRQAAFVTILVVGLLTGLGIYLYRAFRPTAARSLEVRNWITRGSSEAGAAIRAGERCGDAPFVYPTDGLIGYLWGDSFSPNHKHQGLDIFGGGDVDVTPVVAAYDGYLSRLPEWKSAVILRIPDDPLQPGRQIWLYYAHMADRDGNSFIAAEFPPGATEVFIKAGTLLGYPGNYSGDPNNPIGVHLHFSIVRDDSNGEFLNELKIANTLDPSPYFNMRLNANENRDKIPVCEQ